MATIEEAFVALALSVTEISDLIDTRLYPLLLLQDPQYPAAGYQIINRIPHYDHQGNANLFSIRMQVDCLSKSYAEARQVQQAFELLPVQPGIVSGINFQFIRIDDLLPSIEGNFEIFKIETDFIIWYNVV